MSVRAKFRVRSIERTLGSRWDKEGKRTEQEVQTIKMYPVTDGSEENKEFFANTPQGTLELGVLNTEAAKYFELEKEYYLDFTRADNAS